ncbi:MAG TPA: DinB family protein [Candidatus Sulfotelmatobacter sp.]
MLLTDVHLCAWADRNLLAGCAALTAEHLARDLRISHTSILATLRHIYDGERVWLDCLTTTADLGIWPLPQGPAPEYSLDTLMQNWPQIWAGYGRWLDELPESSLAIELMLHLPGGVERRFPRWKILRHVLEHSTMHRGQVVGMIRMLGYQPPPGSPMDYYLSDEPVISA